MTFRRFEPGQQEAMYRFMNKEGTAFLDAHGNQVDEAVFYSLSGAAGGAGGGKILHSALNLEMIGEVVLTIGACYSDRTVDPNKNPKLRAAKGAEGTGYLDDALKENFGIEFEGLEIQQQ